MHLGATSLFRNSVSHWGVWLPRRHTISLYVEIEQATLPTAQLIRIRGHVDGAQVSDKGRTALIESFVGLARHLARRCSQWSLTQDDLDQVAVLGVIEAVDTYSPARGPLKNWVGRNIKYALGDEFARARRQCRAMGRLSIDPVDHSNDDEGEQQHEDLWEALEELPYRDQEHLIDGYGLDGYPAMTLVQLGVRGGYSAKASGRRQRATVQTLRAALTT